MARIDDTGGGPTLNAKAKHFERELFKVFSVQSYAISTTQTDWQGAQEQLKSLAKDVRTVKGELEAPDGGKGWTGPAAVAALSSLQKLSHTLDQHADEIGTVDASLGDVVKAVGDAQSAWFSQVASISTYVDPEAHKRLPAPYLPTAENTSKYSVRDPEAAAAAEDALWEERNQAAKTVLDQLGTDTKAATAKMPIESKNESETPYENQGPASTQRTPGTASQSTSGGYLSGGHVVGTGQLDDDGKDRGDDTTVTVLPPRGPEEPVYVVCEGFPTDDRDPNLELDPDLDPNPGPDPDLGPGPGLGLDPISSDGDVTGSTGLTPGSNPGGTQGATASGPGGVSAGGLAAGGIGGAAGVGGLLRGRSGGGAFLSGAAPRGGATSGAAPRGGATSVGGNAAGSRGAAARAGAVGRPGVTPGTPGGGGAATRGGASARGGGAARGSAVKGATGSGRYGVPKLGAGNNVAPAGGGQAGRGTGAGSGKGTGRAGARGGGGRNASMGAAASGGTRKADDKDQPQDVERLTHEDEEKWFDGTEESSPQVWQ